MGGGIQGLAFVTIPGFPPFSLRHFVGKVFK